VQVPEGETDGLSRTEGSMGVAMEQMLRQSLTSFPFDFQARLFDAHSVGEIYEIGVGMLTRIPATISIRIFQRNDFGEMVAVHAWQSPFKKAPAVANEVLSQAIHQRWIAAHRVGAGLKDFSRPFVCAPHPEWLLVPMLVGEELIGAIAAERRDGATFPYAAEDLVALGAAAAGMSWAIQSIFLRSRTDVLRDPEVRAELIAHERREVGRELHDNVVQDLAYISLKIELADRYIGDNPTVAAGELRAMREILDRALTELRRTIGELRRPAVARRGITGQLRSLVSGMPEASAFDMDLDLRQISGVQLVPEVERAVVGIVREALQNVRKHANAQSVRLEVRRADEELRVYIADDGVGMVSEGPTDGREHFGMDLMRELAEDLGGTLDVMSGGGKGTQIRARLPLVLPAEGKAPLPGLPVDLDDADAAGQAQLAQSLR
jgi:signal transduction histidine kinase